MASSSSSDASRLANTIRKDLADLPLVNPSASIYKVPKELQTGNEKYFTPKTVSIGPLHVETQSSMHVIKTRYLNSFISRLPQGVLLEDVIRVLQGLEESARGCYAENISLTCDEFIRLMLIDGCFILQLLWRYGNKKEADQGDPIFLKGRAKWAMLYNLQQDLLLLENQLPFFVLFSLYELILVQECNPRQALVDSVINFFDSIAPTKKLRPVTNVEPKHLLDLVMFSLFPRPSLEPDSLHGVNNPPESPLNVEALPKIGKSLENSVDIDRVFLETSNHRENSVDVRSASELDLSGVRFTKCIKENSYLNDITFRDGVLYVPTVVLLDSTASLFWNLLALEQCSDSKEYGCVFISYISFMDNLICDNKDVEIFTRNDLLLSWVNDAKEFLLLFNHLALAADMDGINEFSEISRQLERYCRSNVHPLRAYIARNYFEVRWDLMNTVMLFIFTVTQTIFAILDYNRKGKK
ncbi:UPF0481 protein At3g47200-like [Impatiens glandulifera]|uniref:UPF0481 protein At3g47200-like n=1 Tax=Impatiens glandulifera TaxID=253017 RepID=UPI001FB06D9E|nr:UPF0481 protein At3g47200-like [Impatiens glandulifera]